MDMFMNKNTFADLFLNVFMDITNLATSKQDEEQMRRHAPNCDGNIHDRERMR